MKQNLRRAVNLSALVLTAWLLMGLFMGCPNGSGPNRPNESAQPNGPVQPTDPSIFKTDGHGVITGYTCTKDKLPANLVIPAKIGEEVITKIRRAVFYECTGLTSVYFPASLTAIGVAAFEGCRGLTEVKLPANLTKIGCGAFIYCINLTSAVFANTNGWKVYEYGGGSYIGSISSSNLAVPATAAKYLREEVSDGGYCDKYWEKN